MSDTITITTVTLTLERATKGTYLFSNKEKDQQLQNIYIRKSAFPNGSVPQRIKVTVEVA